MPNSHSPLRAANEASPHGYGYKMRYPDTTPLLFSGARAFVEMHGTRVWCELCDVMPAEIWFNVTHAAGQLSCLGQYKHPERYLRAVLSAVIADYAARSDDYENRPPVIVRGSRLIEVKI